MRAVEDERDLCALWQVRIELRDDGRRHVDGAVLFVEAVGRFDFAHFLARRHVHAEHLLDRLFFFGAGFEQVEPQRLFGKCRGVVPGYTGEPLGLRDEYAQHVRWPMRRNAPVMAAASPRQRFFSLAARSLISCSSWPGPPASTDVRRVLAVHDEERHAIHLVALGELFGTLQAGADGERVPGLVEVSRRSRRWPSGSPAASCEWPARRSTRACSPSL